MMNLQIKKIVVSYLIIVVSSGADPDYPIGGAQIFYPLGCISGGQTRARSARELIEGEA